MKIVNYLMMMMLAFSLAVMACVFFGRRMAVDTRASQKPVPVPVSGPEPAR